MTASNRPIASRRSAISAGVPVQPVALRFIDEARKDNKPFFLYLPYLSPHNPLQTFDDPTVFRIAAAAMQTQLETCNGKLPANPAVLGAVAGHLEAAIELVRAGTVGVTARLPLRQQRRALHGVRGEQPGQPPPG